MQPKFDIEAALGSLVARNGIGHATFQRGLDRRDASLMSSAFREEASVDYRVFDGPAEGFCDLMSRDINPAGQPS